MALLEKKFKRLWYKNIIRMLERSDPEQTMAVSRRKAVHVFQRACRQIPFYQELQKNSGVSPAMVRTIDDFHRLVPIVDKKTIYERVEHINELFGEANIERIQSILLSSGSSGSFSYGVNTQQEVRTNTQFLGVLLDYFFNILDESTLIINCLAQAVKLPSIHAVVVEVGPRGDSLLYILETLAPKFKQTIIIGDNFFLKNALEEGAVAGLNYAPMKIHLIVGGVYLPENLRNHLARIIGVDLKDPSTGYVVSSMGISELGLNLFFGSKETIALRQLVMQDDDLRRALLPEGYPPFLPMFFNYFPQGFYIEEHGQEIVITNLNPDARIPLIRYNTRDIGKIIPYAQLRQTLEDCGHDPALYLTPFKSPLVLMYGRNEWFDWENARIYPTQIQDAIYGHPEAARATTGYFRLHKPDGKACIEIQLNRKIELTPELKALFHRIVETATGHHFPLHFYSYQEFPYGMTLDYERKFKYL